MSISNCCCKCGCTTVALVASGIVGVITAFLQITGMITLTPVFLWVALGIAIGFLGILMLSRSSGGYGCACSALNALLAGILGTILFAVILLAVGIVEASVISAILVGLLLLFFTLILTSAACYVRDLNDCGQS